MNSLRQKSWVLVARLSATPSCAPLLMLLLLLLFLLLLFGFSIRLTTNCCLAFAFSWVWLVRRVCLDFLATNSSRAILKDFLMHTMYKYIRIYMHTSEYMHVLIVEYIKIWLRIRRAVFYIVHPFFSFHVALLSSLLVLCCVLIVAVFLLSSDCSFACLARSSLPSATYHFTAFTRTPSLAC